MEFSAAGQQRKLRCGHAGARSSGCFSAVKDRSTPDDLRFFFLSEQQFADEYFSSVLRSNQLNAGFRELTGQGIGDHAVLGFPRTPVDREDAAGPTRVEPQREFVENLVRSGVIGLAAVSVSRGDG